MFDAHRQRRTQSVGPSALGNRVARWPRQQFQSCCYQNFDEDKSFEFPSVPSRFGITAHYRLRINACFLCAKFHKSHGGVRDVSVALVIPLRYTTSAEEFRKASFAVLSLGLKFLNYSSERDLGAKAAMQLPGSPRAKC